MLRKHHLLSTLAVAGLALLLSPRAAPAQYPVGDRPGVMSTGRDYYESRGPGYSAYSPAAVFSGRYDFFPGKYTGYYLPSRFATSNGFYATAPTGETPIMMTSLNYPGIYGSYATGLATGTTVNVAPGFQTVLENRPSDNPVGAPYAPLQRPLAEVPYKDRVELRTRPTELTTDETGPSRQFQSPPLDPGRAYTYDVRASWRAGDGQEVTRNRRLTVRAGDHLELDFNRGLMPPAEPESERPTLRTRPLPPRERAPAPRQ